MTTKEHKKHNDITRPSYGSYCRNEWAIIGTQCGVIRSLADDIVKALSPQYNCAYADAKHIDENENATLPGHVENGAIIEYINHLHHHQFNYTKKFNKFQYRQLFNDADMVLVNGNHFEAKSQVVVIDESKKMSLKKRVPQLTNVELILMADGEMEVFDFIKEALPLWDQLPVYKLDETFKIIEFFKKKMQQAKPLLNGLVLAGGKSVRMGYDKGTISWHGKEQQYYLADLLKNLCNEVYISCRSDQQKEIDTKYQTLADTYTGLGPYGAILSAFREKPDVAWLVVACDLPLLGMETLQYLKDHRNDSSIATAFESPFNGLPEPLITIWEPKSYPILLSFLSQGYNCPVKALQNNASTVLKAPKPEALTNVNTHVEREKMQQVLLKNCGLIMQDELLRYGCQLALPGFTEATQQQLQSAKVLIVGAGGLGCPAAQYLAAAGIGTIGIADFDNISISNLHRQILYATAEVGLSKVSVACKKLQQQNPGICLVLHDIKITSKNVMNVIMPYDIVLDCTDNFDTRYLLNDACVLTGKPLIYGAIYQYEGQVAVWNTLNNDGTRTPNYRDLFPTVNATQIPNCTEGGVMPTLAGIIGCIQANETIKYVTKQGDLLAGKILMLDVQTMQSQIIKLGSVTATNISALTETLAEPVISVKDLKKVIDKDVYELIDVRTSEEHNSFNIGGRHLNVNDFANNTSVTEIEKAIVMYCSSGKRSGEAVKMLRNKFPGTNILSLEGGLKAWEEDV